MAVSPGDIVFSTAGRDKDAYYVVMAVEEGYAYICNGKGRKTDKPKKKKIKHLKTGIGHSDHIAGKLLAGEKVSNAALRRELEQF